MPLSVLIVEDHPMVAHAMANELGCADDIDATIAPTEAEAVERICDPGVDWFRVFLDLDVPGAHGLSLAKKILAAGLGARCCIVSATDRPEIIAEADQLGFMGYIVKACPYTEFRAAVGKVLGGQRSFPATTSHAPAVRLSYRQEQLLNFVRDGLTSREIAERIHLSQGTVNNCITALLAAMGAANRGQAVAMALDLGLLPPRPAADASIANACRP